MARGVQMREYTEDEIRAYEEDAYDRWRDDQMEKSQSSNCPNCNHKEEQSDCECCKNNR